MELENKTTRDCAHAGCNVIAWLHRLEDGDLRWYCREHFVKANTVQIVNVGHVTVSDFTRQVAP